MYFSKYTTLGPGEILTEFDSEILGLDSKDAKKRLDVYGHNIINSKELRWWKIFFRQFKSPFIYLLFVAAALAFGLGEKIDSFMILGFIGINTILGFAQEYHSEKSLCLLKKFVIARARVRRDGKEILVNAEELIPGDIVIVETGDVIPADIRFLEVDNLTIDESVLTGESVPMVKQSHELQSTAEEVHQASNFGFSGTTIVGGRGEGIVVSTGKNTFMGEIAQLTIETHRESTFEKGINKFSGFILKMILVILIFLFVSNILIKGEDANIAELILFSIALAVSVVPEALPLVTTLSLSRGALRLAKQKVVVKRLSAVEDLGSIEILCTDKTGTITENKLQVDSVFSENKSECIFYGTLAASFLTEKDTEPNNAFDLALWKELSVFNKKRVKKFARLHEIPFDPVRRRNDVLVETDKGCVLIVRGAPEEILSLCKTTNKDQKEKLEEWSKNAGLMGNRVLAVGIKNIQSKNCKIKEEENNLEFLGLISFVDPIKSSTRGAVKRAKELGVKVKVLTGDSKEVAGAVGVEIGLIKNFNEVLTGLEIEQMSEDDRAEAVERYNIFARVSPQQKFLIIQTLQKKFEVGFLGEGINDAPALKLANVALVVEGASDIAREASDIVLLNSSLSVIVDGIKGGREIFANTIKYLKITLISNFGNFYAIAIASLIITFLPMLPVQILLLNLLSDFPMIAIAADNVDSGELRRPKTYNVREVIAAAIFLGIVSTVFDFIFFALFYKQAPAVLQTNWFIGSVLTEIVLIYSVRTKFFFLRGKRTSLVLGGLSLAAVLATVILPFTSLGIGLFKFQTPSITHLYLIFGVVVCYFVVTEIVKIIYYRSMDRVEKVVSVKA